MAAAIAGRASVVLTGIAIARFLGYEAFALFSFLHITATSFSNVAMLGLMNGIPRFVARMQAGASDATVSAAFLSAAVVCTGLSIAAAIVVILPADVIGLPRPSAKALLVALLLAIGTNTAMMAANNGLENFRRVASANICMGMVLMLGGVIGIGLEDVKITLLAYIFAAIASVLLLVGPIISTFRNRLRQHNLQISRSHVMEVLAYCGPMFLAGVMTNTGIWLAGRSLLAQQDGARQFAELAVGIQWFGLAMMASNVVTKAILPRLSRQFLTDLKDEQNETERVGLYLSVGGALGVFAIVALLHPYILLLYGPDLADARWSLLIMVAGAVLASPVSVITTKLIAAGMYNRVLLINSVWWCSLVSGAVFAAGYGANTVAVVVACSYGIFLFAAMAFSSTERSQTP